MDGNDKNQKIAILILIVALISIFIYNIFFNNRETEEKIDTDTISLVRDNSKFFTVSSCVSKYLNYLSIMDTNNLLILLSDQYKSNNNVNADNIYSFIGNIYGNQVFSPKKMFKQRLSKTSYKYYVYGTVEQELINSTSNSMDYYIVVILDEKNMTFAIEPYDGAIFN